MNELLERQFEVSRYGRLNPIQKWENIKLEIAKASQQFGKNTANDKHTAICALREYIQDLEDKIETLSQEQIRVLQNSKAELDELYEEKARGAMFRSKAQWMCEGERNTKYFYNMERLRSDAKTVQSLFRQGRLLDKLWQ